MLHSLIASVPPVNADAQAACRAHWDQLTKPQGSLAQLEDLAATLAAIAGTPVPTPGPTAVLVFAGDHGVAAEGVSAYPQAVTVQMLLNIRAGGAGVNVLSRQAGASLSVVDVGSLGGPEGEVAELPPLGPLGVSLQIHRIKAGTGNIAVGPAMTPAEAMAAILTGARIGREAAGPSKPSALPLVAIGELGIANTTVAAALAAALTGLQPADLVGPGTGVDLEGRGRKVAAVQRALLVNRPQADDAVDCLAKVGGLEFGAMAGAILGAASARAAVVLDGFSALVAGLLAVRLCPAVKQYLIAGTQSPEPGQAPVLAALDLKPLLRLGLRLGEASGAALALPIIESTLAIGREMATFSSAGVSNRDDA